MREEDEFDLDVLVLGAARGGTTAVARLLHYLGFSNAFFPSVNCEDHEINVAYVNRDVSKVRSLLHEHGYVGSRGKSLKVTVQGESATLSEFFLHGIRVRNLVGVYKNPLAVARRRNLRGEGQVANLIFGALAELAATTELVSSHAGGLFVDYDLLVSNPVPSLLDLAAGLELNADQSSLESAFSEAMSHKAQYLTRFEENLRKT